jgi:hypothetical protein
MSVVTEVVLLVYPTSPRNRFDIASYDFADSREDREPQHLKKLNSDAAGGNKYASWDVFQAAFNYVALDVIETFWNWLDPQLYAVMTVATDYHDDPLLYTRGLDHVSKDEVAP